MSLAGSIPKQLTGPARRWWQLVFLLGAAAALAAGLWLQQRTGKDPRSLHITVSREQALEIARRVAREHGLDPAGWGESVAFSRRPAAARYFGSRRTRPSSRARELAPDVVITAFLMKPEGGLSCRVAMGPDGHVVAYQLGGPQMPAPAEAIGDSEARALAEKELREWLGDMRLTRLGQPEVSTTEEAGIVSARRFVWRTQPSRLPELEFEFTFDLAGSRVVRREVEVHFADSFIDREMTPSLARQQFAGTLRTLAIVLLALYAFYRYARRALEGEAPHARVALLAGVVALFGLIVTFADPFAASGGPRPDRPPGPIPPFQWIAVFLVVAIQGLLLGVSYGAGEGEVREGWPGKLTSLDAVVTGRVFSSNAGSALLIGFGSAAWLFACFEGAIAWLGPAFARPPYSSIAYSFGLAPMPVLLLNLAVSSLVTSVVGLLVPLTFLHRHVHARPLFFGLLSACALLCADLSGPIEPDSWAYLLRIVALAAALLIPFFAWDYMASAAAVFSFGLLTVLGDLAGIMPQWAVAAIPVAAVAGALVVVFVAAAWRGRECDEEEVRPPHARNLAERLSLEAELGAAREAQARLLPRRPPQIPGLGIAASCTPAREVGGDFYDFFPLAGGRLCLVMAEGGKEGMASALTIALAKGFLAYESQAGSSVDEMLARLEETLAEYLKRPSGHTNLALLVADPAQGSVRVVRRGENPRLLVLSPGGAVSDLEPPAALNLEPGDSLLIHTGGLSRLLESRNGATPRDLLRSAMEGRRIESAGQLHELLLAGLLPAGGRPRAELTDDLTAVVIRYEPGQAQRLEEVA